MMTCLFFVLFFSMEAGEIFQGEESGGRGGGKRGVEGSGGWGPPVQPHSH